MKKPAQNMTNSQRKVQRTEAIQARKAIEENFVPVEVLPPR
jgi:predicted RNA-binding Zn ribbon-like protein